MNNGQPDTYKGLRGLLIETKVINPDGSPKQKPESAESEAGAGTSSPVPIMRLEDLDRFASDLVQEADKNTAASAQSAQSPHPLYPHTMPRHPNQNPFFDAAMKSRNKKARQVSKDAGLEVSASSTDSTTRLTEPTAGMVITAN